MSSSIMAHAMFYLLLTSGCALELPGTDGTDKVNREAGDEDDESSEILKTTRVKDKNLDASATESGAGDESLDSVGSGPGDGERDPVFDKYKEVFDSFTDDVFAPIQPFNKFSGGNGGPAGLTSGTHSFKSASGSYRLRVPTTAGPYGLLVFFHGDGRFGQFTTLDTIGSPYDTVGEEKNIITLVARAPDQFSWWYESGALHSDYIHDLIQNVVMKGYDVDQTRVHFSGTSGGANFIAGMLGPRHGYHYRATYIVLCGGEKNLFSQFKTNEEFVKNNRFVFHTALGDARMIDQAKRSFEYYKKKGFEVKGSFPEGEGHCGFNAPLVTSGYIQ